MSNGIIGREKTIGLGEDMAKVLILMQSEGEEATSVIVAADMENALENLEHQWEKVKVRAMAGWAKVAKQV